MSTHEQYCKSTIIRTFRQHLVPSTFDVGTDPGSVVEVVEPVEIIEPVEVVGIAGVARTSAEKMAEMRIGEYMLEASGVPVEKIARWEWKDGM
jgi:hypothetical protein